MILSQDGCDGNCGKMDGKSEVLAPGTISDTKSAPSGSKSFHFPTNFCRLFLLKSNKIYSEWEMSFASKIWWYHIHKLTLRKTKQILHTDLNNRDHFCLILKPCSLFWDWARVHLSSFHLNPFHFSQLKTFCRKPFDVCFHMHEPGGRMKTVSSPLKLCSMWTKCTTFNITFSKN